MKFKSVLVLLVLLSAIIFAGCATKPEPYSFVQEGQNFSSIIFERGNPGVYFVTYSGQKLPKANSGHRWEPISFPSGRELRFIVHANFSETSKTTLSGFGLLGAVVNTVQDIRAVSRNVDADLEFVCGPLQAGGEYKLYFTKEPGMPGKNILTLIDIKTNNVIKQQEFEVNFGGDAVK